jgi:CRISPR-associated protein Cas2
LPYVVFAYDVRDDTRRLRVARVLKNALERVQKSVFEGELDSERLELVQARALRHIRESEDSLRVYVLCARCARAVRAFGVSPVVEDPDVLIV